MEKFKLKNDYILKSVEREYRKEDERTFLTATYDNGLFEYIVHYPHNPKIKIPTILQYEWLDKNS